MKKCRWNKTSWIAAFLAGALWACSFGVSAEDMAEEEWEILDEAETEAEIGTEAYYCQENETESSLSSAETMTESEAFLIEAVQVEDPMLYTEDSIYSGTCGVDVNWELLDGTLIVTGPGNGVMEYAISPPWNEIKSNIYRVDISGVKNVAVEAFSRCINLEEINLGEGVQELEGECFLDCPNLSQINLPNSLEMIWDYAFALSGSNLNNIYIPKNVRYIDGTAFIGLGVKGYTVAPGNGRFYSADGVLFKRDVVDSLYAYPRLKNSILYQVPEGVALISLGAFERNTTLQEVILPDSVTTIQPWAFRRCTALQKIVFPGSLTSVMGSAFEGCSSLKTVEFAEVSNTHSLYSECFKDCTSLEMVKLSRDTVIIDEGCFNGCKALQAIIIPASVTDIGRINHEVAVRDVFEGCEDSFTIYGYTGSCAETYANDKNYRFSAIPHEHQFERVIVNAATCFSTGEVVIECSCGIESGTETLPQLSHSFGEWEFYMINEEQQLMYETRRCSLCSHGEVRSQAKVIRVEDLQDMQFNVGDTVVVDTRVSAKTVSLKSSDSKAVSLTKLTSRYVLLKATKTSKKVTISYQKNSKTYKCDVSVEAQTSYINVTGEKSRLYIGEETSLLVSRNEDATDELTCRVLDPTVASADINGTEITVKALKKGVTSIQLSAGNIAKEYTITVDAKDTDYLVVTGNEKIGTGDSEIWDISRNDDAQNRIEVSVEDGTFAEAELIGSNIRIQGKKPGITGVIIKSGQKTVRKPIVVQKKQNSIISIASVVKKQPVKGFYLKIAQIGDGKLTFTSNNKKVKVSKTGYVTVKKGFKGKVKITVNVSETERFLSAKKVITVTVKKK